MTKIKLWISDIDGTLMNYDNTYTNEMAELIKKINLSDTKFVLATGRMYMGAKFAADTFNLKTPIVCYQGAMVRLNDEILWQAPVDKKLAREVITYLKEKNLHTHLYANDKLYIDDDDKRIMAQYCNGRGTFYEVVKSFDDVQFESAPKILAVIENPEIMKEVKEELTKKYVGVLKIVQSNPIYLEINNINASKGDALNFLKKYWSLKDEEVLASGDQDNDIDMLKNAGVKVCVGSHSKGLKEIADYCCKDVNSNELVKLIERMVLCE